MTGGVVGAAVAGLVVGAVVMGVVIRVALAPVLAELRSIRCDLLLPLVVDVKTDLERRRLLAGVPVGRAAGDGT